ncbi:mlr6458 [Mesorhizobium japonicum MAFF 303099]|uniref:Mlr6458 protein n=1 Tax=Mesorhizobium japonicum (strain LMG 29417 / CECT 9101 / MAFF 303099) TaxID=266835 RepID=Q989E6_RHILO|nr:mlr6458 [Mesorhizobium japonicum MAFF 303099]
MMAMGRSSLVNGARRGFPRAANVGKAGLDAFDIEHDGAAARKDEFDDAGWLADLDEADRQQGQHLGRLVAGNAIGFGAQHPVEMQHGLPPLIVLAEQARLRLPDETVHGQHETLGRRQEFEVRHLHHGVLDMGRDDAQILVVERDKLEGHAEFVPKVGFSPLLGGLSGRCNRDTTPARGNCLGFAVLAGG